MRECAIICEHARAASHESGANEATPRPSLPPSRPPLSLPPLSLPPLSHPRALARAPLPLRRQREELQQAQPPILQRVRGPEGALGEPHAAGGEELAEALGYIRRGPGGVGGWVAGGWNERGGRGVMGLMRRKEAA